MPAHVLPDATLTVQSLRSADEGEKLRDDHERVGVSKHVRHTPDPQSRLQAETEWRDIEHRELYERFWREAEERDERHRRRREERHRQRREEREERHRLRRERHEQQDRYEREMDERREQRVREERARLVAAIDESVLSGMPPPRAFGRTRLDRVKWGVVKRDYQTRGLRKIRARDRETGRQWLVVLRIKKA